MVISSARVSIVAALFLTACPEEHDPDPDALTCTPVVDGESRVLVDHALWVVTPPEDDPWAEHRPVDLDCSEPGKLEDFAGNPALEINTVRCDYTTLQQPALSQGCAGETLFVWLWNYALTAPEDATSFVAVQIGEDRVWEGELPIPSPPGLVYDHVILPADIPAGTPIYFHVRNHGNNQYELLDISIVNPAHADID